MLIKVENVDIDILKEFIIVEYYKLYNNKINVCIIKIKQVNNNIIDFSYLINNKHPIYHWYILIEEYIKLSRIKKIEKLRNVN
jgi:hypothetical protein